ncbi:MAG TPA: phosphoenolpyruvate carboxykinase (GTP), partial [Thermoleophilaceae bacterium]|nr:phosphoenolpyruvate carboxykinase (GTP) [Thermoleophilaceae bacterium]
TNPNAIKTLSKSTIFTNCALTDEGDVWWEGLTKEPPAHAIDWRGNDWTPEADTTAAHPNARFTVSAAQAPSIADEWEDPAGVPIDAVMFGGRRSTVVPLVTEARDWEHGVFLGASMSSEKTAAATGNVGELRFDPFAMLPFCGYNMADYFGYWLSLKKREGATLPRLFYVNWFRKDADGKFLWPGFGDNVRVLKWIFRRCEGKADAEESLLGLVPSEGQIDLEGLDVSEDDMRELRNVDAQALRDQIPQMRQHFAQFGDRLPQGIHDQMEALEKRLEQS